MHAATASSEREEGKGNRNDERRVAFLTGECGTKDDGGRAPRTWQG